MTKAEAEREYRETILPAVRARYESDGRIDAPARAEAWNAFTDALRREGRITPRQYSTWTHPMTHETRTFSERS
ncbi:MAG: hypothetical protein GWO02_01305 [Gammaproteobacteria bacterium]|nr:hypothetical protein [Gammaproteobacteria bacterium]